MSVFSVRQGNMRNVGRRNSRDRWKGGRTRNSIGSCSLCGRNLHKQTSSSTAFWIFVATGKRKRERKKGKELTLFISLSLSQTPSKRSNREFQPGKRCQCRLTDASSFSPLSRVLFFFSARIYSEEFAWSFIFPRAKDISTVKESCYITCFEQSCKAKRAQFLHIHRNKNIVLLTKRTLWFQTIQFVKNI